MSRDISETEHMCRNGAISGREACRPWCGGNFNPNLGSSSSPDDDRHSGTNNPCQKIVGQRPQSVQYVKAVKAKLDGRVFAGESAAPLPTALRYGKGLEMRPIFTRTVCHSHHASATLIDDWDREVLFCKPVTPVADLV
ncbi:Mitochondrial group I intron splicing factor CCM1 [Dissostichus eleginoides]|uniref:Mitochondrial group I intron splicing factor CCM1 n=1 Tax=Dissostichus eleginoides TaxID=100907 RepID=A0AAD9BMI5_DISEL|nr:Mitochondrial group I intron splicing factor CCM1 [Dissostichus eleginoides]